MTRPLLVAASLAVAAFSVAMLASAPLVEPVSIALLSASLASALRR